MAQPLNFTYPGLWHLLENHLVESLHFSHVHDQLCSSQRRAFVIIGSLSHQQMSM